MEADGSYTANASTNYLTAATSLVSADEALDAKLKETRDLVDNLGANNVSSVNGETPVAGDVTLGGVHIDTAHSATNYTAAGADLDSHLAGIDSALLTESTARADADTTLQSNIDAEATTRANADSALQTELDATQTGAGLEADGTYSANGTANYISAVTSLKGADEALDAKLKETRDLVDNLGANNVSSVNGETPVASSGSYDDIYATKGSDAIYQKQGETFKPIEKSEDGLYHVSRGKYETLYGDGPLGIKQVVAGYKEGERPSESTASRYLYNYAHGAQADKIEEKDNYDVHSNKDGEMIGFVQRSADGVYKPLVDEKTAKATEAETELKHAELRKQEEAKSLQQQTEAANEARKQELIAKLKTSPNDITKKDLDELGALTGTRLLKFEADWCIECPKLDDKLNASEKVTGRYEGGEYFKDSTFIQSVNADDYRKVADFMKVVSLPDSRVIKLNSNGDNEDIGQILGNMPLAKYYSSLADILSK